MFRKNDYNKLRNLALKKSTKPIKILKLLRSLSEDTNAERIEKRNSIMLFGKIELIEKLELKDNMISYSKTTYIYNNVRFEIVDGVYNNNNHFVESIKEVKYV